MITVFTPTLARTLFVALYAIRLYLGCFVLFPRAGIGTHDYILLFKLLLYSGSFFFREIRLERLKEDRLTT